MLYLESLSIGSKTMVALALAEFPDNTGHVILAMGGLDNKVHLYSRERSGKVYISFLLSLSPFFFFSFLFSFFCCSLNIVLRQIFLWIWDAIFLFYL